MAPDRRPTWVVAASHRCDGPDVELAGEEVPDHLDHPCGTERYGPHLPRRRPVPPQLHRGHHLRQRSPGTRRPDTGRRHHHLLPPGPLGSTVGDVHWGDELLLPLRRDRIGGGRVFNPIRFAGGYLDTYTGLYHFDARAPRLLPRPPSHPKPRPTLARPPLPQCPGGSLQSRSRLVGG